MFNNKTVTLDLIRSAYITDRYNDKRFSLRQKEELAKLMRNSVRVAETTYHKIDDACDENEEKQIMSQFISKIRPKEEELNEEEIINEFLKRLNIENKPDVKKCVKKCVKGHQKEKKFDVKEWGKEYRSKNTETIKQKQKQRYDENKDNVLRNKILWNINSKGSKPRADTVKKYNLVFDGTNWV